MYGNACNIMVCLWIQIIVSFIVTYHNLYAIIIVVMAFVAMESATLEVDMTSDLYVVE